MMRLVKHGLMYGNLIEVSSPAMVARYNRALEHMTGRTTSLQEFHIDISGFSPEIGDELGDPQYLNPNGCNRQFILLSVTQKTAPLLNASFSTSRSILRRYIDENEEQLFALTIRDAVVGELVNTIFAVTSPADLVNYRNIQVEADTVGGHVEAGDELGDRIEQFMSDPDAWWDDVLIAEMIELAKHTGDIIRTPISLKSQRFEPGNFYTAHFGGFYVFRDVRETACIASRKLDVVVDLPVKHVMTTSDRHDVAAFLTRNGLIEPIIDAKGAQAKSILKQKLDFIVIDTAADNEENLSNVSRRNLRSLKRKYHRKLPPEYHAINDVLQRLDTRGGLEWPTPDNPAYFYLMRSRDHRDKHLVNMLLAELTPLDFRQLFICHKDEFYGHYQSWSEAKKSYAAQFLADEYMVDKVGTREELFGPEPNMSEDHVDFGFGRNMGPWGAIPRHDDDDDDDDEDDDD
ncbi:MAG: hypothetical protein JJ866_11490 [Roseibium sp.]|uniref:DUF6638 family protein n=1 Tax=Roseibium sp. TaxID=1936156 RepID=UPI001B2C23B3|nr:DUF6638 family protein [Roseibium sp.]MBO6507103.1 hypothetical protein [Roseibium sp.]MBO6892554.1 hypothetical protein [Roseibium sp.]MBO6930339.1 hypothetical protein [Roseibium sp.]